MFESISVPATLCQIVDITNKDGSPLAPDNWRRKNIGKITMCWFAGGFGQITPFFRISVWMKGEEVDSVDLHWDGNASTGQKFPVEVEPGVFDFESHTSIYRFRVLDRKEKLKVMEAIRLAVTEEQKARKARKARLAPPVGDDEDLPPS